MDENKNIIVFLLETLLKCTRFGSDIEKLSYIGVSDEEYVVIKFKNNSCEHLITVTADSGIAIVKDVLNYLGA